MAASNIQAAGTMVQAAAAVIDNLFNLGGIMVSTVNASESMEASRSSMDTMMTELRAMKLTSEDKFRKYWFPNYKFALWKQKVADIAGRVDSLINDYSNLRSYNFIHRARVTTQIGTRIKEIEVALKEGKEFGDALVKREIKRVVSVDTPINIQNILTLNQKLKDILERLDQSGVTLIKFQGEMGTGKRTILENLNNNKSVQNTFDIVIYVRTSDIMNHSDITSIIPGIQHLIAGRLGLNIEGDKNVDIVAEKLRAELNDTKYLLLLDDVKVDEDIYAIGIPRNTNGSKIVITTNFKYVCARYDSICCVEMRRLTEEDAWQMFENIVKPKKHLIATARRVARWCDCHFYLIRVVAENFKSLRSLESWTHGFTMLKRGPTKEDTFDKPLENFLEFSYDRLDDNEKRCFLFCALYPNQSGSGSKIPVDCLFDCWAAQGFVKYYRAEGINQSGHYTVEKLIKYALLDESSNKYVNMTKVFRRAAMKILQQHGQFKCLFGDEAQEELQINHCTNTHWISLADCDMDSLPNNTTCPNLTTLFLQKNSKLENLPDSFFSGMEKLIVLDLHKTAIKSMTPLRNMQKLKVLYVYGCNILTFSFNEEKHYDLEVLDMRGTTVIEIPDCIKILKRLRRLMISIPGDDEVDLRILELSSLKELIIDVKSNSVNEDEDLYIASCNKVMENTIKKIDTLKGLSTFQFHFKSVVVKVIEVLDDVLKIFVPNQGSLVHFVKEKRFLNYKHVQVYIGVRAEPNFSIPNCFTEHNSYVIFSDKIVNDTSIEKIFEKVKTLILIQGNNIKHLDDVIGISPVSGVNGISEISSVNRISSISVVNGISRSSVIYIENCLVHKCRKIETVMQSARFSSVRLLVLSKCSELKVLFPINAAAMGIEHLEIRGCSSLERINMKLTSGCGDVFPKLKTLILHKLPELKNISSVMEWLSLDKLQVHKCDKLTKLPLDINSANNLREIVVENDWWENLQLDHDIKQRFQSHIREIQ